MGKRSGMRGLIGPLHHQLQIRQQSLHPGPMQRGSDIRLSPHGGQRHPFRCMADPIAEQISGLMQKSPQHRVEPLGGCEPNQVRL